MAKKPRPKLEIELDWYYISRESVRKWLVVFLLVAGGVVWGVHSLLSRDQDVTKRAEREIASGEELIARCRTLPEAARLKDEMEVAAARLAGAKSALFKGRPTEAISQALDAQSIARQMLGGISTLRGDANIVDTGGKVEVQRANRATWENAKVGMKLFDGDFLKTGPTGLAEVMAADGTLYRIKPETLFEVHRTSAVPGGAPGEERHRSAVKLIVDLPDRQKTEAVVTVTEEGSFFWRVASLGKGSLTSEWSPVRRFKVVAGTASSGRDKRPPDLTLERSKVIGNLVMVSGKTEPG